MSSIPNSCLGISQISRIKTDRSVATKTKPIVKALVTAINADIDLLEKNIRAYLI